MVPVKRFEDMEVWQTARVLTRRIYELTKEQPWARDYGLRDQIRRSAVSVMSNIAEGYECDSPAQFERYLAYAKGSAGEVRAQLYVALDAGYLSREVFDRASELAQSCSRQLYGLIAYLRSHAQARRVSEALNEYAAEGASGDSSLTDLPMEPRPPCA
jgi:four helix bundle protein